MEWNFYVPPCTTCGQGALGRIAEEFADFPGHRPLIVASSRELATNPVQDLLQAFKKQHIQYHISTNVAPESPVPYVAKIADDCTAQSCDSMIAIGGGSVLDLAKAASVLVTNGGNIEDYYGLHKVSKPSLPKILVPTTAGTGSEATNIAVLGDKDAQSKKGIVSQYLFADWVILDPVLTYAMPGDLVLSSGLDAFCQCVEGYTSKGVSPLVEMYALKGMDLISRHLIDAMNGLESARDQMLLGAYVSGVAITFGNAGANLGHALGNTIGGIYGSPHGLSVTAVLEQSLRFNSFLPAYGERLAEINRRLGLDIFDFIENIRKQVVLPTLTDLGVGQEDVPLIAQKVISDQQRLLNNNPRAVTRSDVEAILRASLTFADKAS